MIRLRAGLLLIVMGVSLLAGCSKEPAAEAVPTTVRAAGSGSGTVSGSAGKPEASAAAGSVTGSGSGAGSGSVAPSVPPAMPALARENSVAGQEAFMRHWVAAFNYGMWTGDTKPVDSISTPDAPIVVSMRKQIEEIYGGGGRVEGNRFYVSSFASLPATEGVARPSLMFGHDAGREHYGDGTVKEIPVKAVDTTQARISYSQGAWTLHDWWVVASGDPQDH